MTAADTAAAIRTFAADVRAALNDLPAEDVEELTDQLEADLTEQAEDSESETITLGDPIAYANELRASAGLPDRGDEVVETRRPAFSRLADWVRGIGQDAARDIRSSPGGAKVLDFLISLRPFWWVLRGWAVYQVFAFVFSLGGPFGVIPFSFSRWMLLFATVIVSVQWGRGKWLSWRWLPGFRTLVSVCAVFALPILVAVGANMSNPSNYYNEYDAANDPYAYQGVGLTLDGNTVSNIFAYDSNGDPVTNVQLFDQHGNPLVTVADPESTAFTSVYSDEDGTESYLVPSNSVPGRNGWNVYPLRAATLDNMTYPTGSVLGDEGVPTDPQPATPPFRTVQPLVKESDSNSTAAPTTTPVPTDAPETPDPSAPSATDPATDPAAPVTPEIPAEPETTPGQ